MAAADMAPPGQSMSSYRKPSVAVARLPHRAELLEHPRKDAAGVEPGLGRLVAGPVVHLPEPLGVVVVARDERLHAVELVRLLLEQLGVVDVGPGVALAV